MNAVELYSHTRHLRNALFSRVIAGSFKALGARSIIEMPVLVDGPERISIGRDVLICSDTWLHTSGTHAALEIGDGTRICGHCVLSVIDHVRLGRSVTLGQHVYIADHNHLSSLPEGSISVGELAAIGPVIVEDHAWLGQHSVILPGVRIGSGAVVGPNAVVLEDVPARAVVLGTPARVVGRLDDPRAREVHDALR
jgi:acetyltransferase-like isoleucine patch superfamily enzyme